jgi:hypothetical protein
MSLPKGKIFSGFYAIWAPQRRGCRGRRKKFFNFIKRLERKIFPFWLLILYSSNVYFLATVLGRKKPRRAKTYYRRAFTRQPSEVAFVKIFFSHSPELERDVILMEVSKLSSDAKLPVLWNGNLSWMIWGKKLQREEDLPAGTQLSLPRH